MKKVYLIISIDTECDKNVNWNIPQPMMFKNIEEQERQLFPLFKKYDIKPTYLLSPEVIKEDSCVIFFQNNQDWIELGTHLHLEFIEPQANMNVERTSGVQINLSKEVEYQKLKNLTNLFVDKFHFPPTSFRSGRFGSSRHTTSMLASLNYRVDSSIVPYSTRTFNDIHINSWDKTPVPYWESFNSRKILQVPLTLINPDYHQLPFFLKWGIGKTNSITRRITKRLGYGLHTYWLRPYRYSGEKLIGIAEYTISKAFKQEKFAVLNVMFHSNEILPGASPYCASKLEVDEFVASLDKLFDHLSKTHDLCPIGLSDLYTIYGQN